MQFRHLEMAYLMQIELEMLNLLKICFGKFMTITEKRFQNFLQMEENTQVSLVD